MGVKSRFELSGLSVYVVRLANIQFPIQLHNIFLSLAQWLRGREKEPKSIGGGGGIKNQSAKTSAQAALTAEKQRF